MANSRIHFYFFWINGHQDDLGWTISYEGHLNIDCDNLAKAYWNETKPNSDNFTIKRISDQGWLLKINNIFKTKVRKEDIYDYSFGITSSVDYSNYRIPLETGSFEDINWDTINIAMDGLPRIKRQWLTMHISNIAIVGQVMYRRKEWKILTCII